MAFGTQRRKAEMTDLRNQWEPAEPTKERHMADKPKRLLFSLTKSDFEVQTFCTGGPGGQHKNAKQNGVRIIHPASGATAEHRDGRDQHRNKAAAFEKLAQTSVFKRWHKAEVARRQGVSLLLTEEQIQDRVDMAMQPNNLKVEEACTGQKP